MYRSGVPFAGIDRTAGKLGRPTKKGREYVQIPSGHGVFDYVDVNGRHGHAVRYRHGRVFVAVAVLAVAVVAVLTTVIFVAVRRDGRRAESQEADQDEDGQNRMHTHRPQVTLSSTRQFFVLARNMQHECRTRQSKSPHPIISIR